MNVKQLLALSRTKPASNRGDDGLESAQQREASTLTCANMIRSRIVSKPAMHSLGPIPAVFYVENIVCDPPIYRLSMALKVSKEEETALLGCTNMFPWVHLKHRRLQQFGGDCILHFVLIVSSSVQVSRRLKACWQLQCRVILMLL
jgi:hypothetical protein